MDDRQKKLESAREFLKSVDNSLQLLFDEFKWDPNGLFNEECEMVACSIDKQHLVPSTSIVEHETSCLWKSKGYHESDIQLPEPVSGADIKLSSEIIKDILSEAGLSASTSRDIPQTSNRWHSEFTRKERLAIYDHVVAHTSQGSVVPEVNYTFEKKTEKRELSAVELAAAERDMKRRRISYKNKVHTNKKNQVEILRDVIQSQMECFEEYVDQKNAEIKNVQPIKEEPQDKALNQLHDHNLKNYKDRSKSIESRSGSGNHRESHGNNSASSKSRNRHKEDESDRKHHYSKKDSNSWSENRDKSRGYQSEDNLREVYGTGFSNRSIDVKVAKVTSCEEKNRSSSNRTSTEVGPTEHNDREKKKRGDSKEFRKLEMKKEEISQSSLNDYDLVLSYQRKIEESNDEGTSVKDQKHNLTSSVNQYKVRETHKQEVSEQTSAFGFERTSKDHDKPQEVHQNDIKFLTKVKDVKSIACHKENVWEEDSEKSNDLDLESNRANTMTDQWEDIPQPLCSLRNETDSSKWEKVKPNKKSKKEKKRHRSKHDYDEKEKKKRHKSEKKAKKEKKHRSKNKKRHKSPTKGDPKHRHKSENSRHKENTSDWEKDSNES